MTTWRPVPDEDGGDGWIQVICTGKRTHEPTRITGVELIGDAGTMTHEGVHWWPPTPGAAPRSGLSWESLTFRCPRCGIHIRRKPERWWRELRAFLGESVRAELDLSLLP